MCDTLTALLVGRYVVRFSSRAILNLLLAFVGIRQEQSADVFRVLDKLDKVGIDKVRRELREGYKDESGDVIRGLGLRREQVEKIEEFLAIKADSRREVVTPLRQIFGRLAGAEAQIDAVARISNHLYALGYGDDRVSLDLSIARGLAYYTGPVFEAILTEAPAFGSVFGGGRYDNLVMRFLGERIPAVGASMGVDRLLAALAYLGTIGNEKSTARVLITNMDPALTNDYLQIAWELRRASIPTELYIGTAKQLGKQLKYADQYEIPLAILYGSNEKSAGEVTVKNMAVGRAKSAKLGDRNAWLAERPGQTTIPRGQLIDGIRRLLAELERTSS